ncbi:MAG: bacterial regulatory protein ArsR family protein 4, partial [Burkholderiales bacterium]|nr:bacterial regulatory protein ArsR family protein 4 [Burkholderiales bacterium]
MVKYSDDELDTVFAALADPTRRGILDSLAGGSRGVSALAAPHGMSLPGFMKHLKVLEDAGLIAREKAGRVVSCELSAAPMQAAAAWMSRYEKFWTDKLDSLARYLYQQEELQSWRSTQTGR